jgi:hypothetical protein
MPDAGWRARVVRNWFPLSVVAAIVGGVGVNALVTRACSEEAPRSSESVDSRDGEIVLADPLSDPKQPASKPATAEVAEETASAKRNAVPSTFSSGERAKLRQYTESLKLKARAGTASERELAMLRALCRQLADSSCRY